MTTEPFFYGCWPVRPDVKPTIELDCFDGGNALLLECTQLPGKPSRQTKIVADWCEFFTSSGNSVTDLYVSTRLPIRLFEAICQHASLRRFGFKWGPIKDFSPISKLSNLTHLGIGSCSATDLAPLAALKSLKMLSIENADRVSDYAPLGKLQKLEYLHIDGAPWSSNKPVPIDNLDFIPYLKKLRGLSIGYVKIADNDWPRVFAQLKHLEELFVPASSSTDTRQAILKSVGNLKLHNLS